MKNLYYCEKKKAYLLFLILIFCFIFGISINFFILYLQKKKFIFIPTKLEKIEVKFKDKNILLTKKNNIWYESSSGYFVRKDFIDIIKTRLSLYPLQQAEKKENKNPYLTLYLNGKRFLEIFFYDKGKYATYIKYKDNFYWYLDNLTKYFPHAKEDYFPKNIVPLSIRNKIEKIKIYKKDKRYIIYGRNGKFFKNKKEITDKIKKYFNSKVNLYLNFTQLSATREYKMIEIKIKVKDTGDINQYVYYPANKSLFTYIVLPQYNLTLVCNGLNIEELFFQ